VVWREAPALLPLIDSLSTILVTSFMARIGGPPAMINYGSGRKRGKGKEHFVN